MNEYINNFIEKSGKYKYAYAVLIINNDIYANPGIIFAESLKRVGCLCDIVALVDKKISLETRLLLKNYFNEIIQIEPIEINHDNSIQKVILSKINVFKMVEYKKIFLIDVDTIIFTNIDIFFTRFKKHQNQEMIYMPDIQNYGFILISPSIKIYNKCLKIIFKYKNELKNFAKPFEFVMNKIYEKSNIKKINIKISYDIYSNVDCIQYRKNKPFLMKSEFSINERQRLNHFKVWFSYLTNIINKYPEIKKFKCLNETLIILKYFLASLSRFTIDFVKSNNIKKLINITNMYGISNDYNNLDYYHLDLTREYTNKFIKYDVDTYDIKSFLEYLDLKNKKFTDYYNYADVKTIISNLEKNDTKLLYVFLNNYIKMHPDTFITMEIYTKDELMNDEITPELKNNLIYKKKLNIKNIPLKNIIFNLYQNFTYNQRINYIDKNLNEKNYILIISIYKMCYPIIDYDHNLNLKLFIFYEQSTKIRFCSIFFNQNSMNYYNDTHTNNTCIKIFNSNDKMCDLNTLKSLLLLETLKKFIFSVYTGNQINNLGIYIENHNEMMIVDDNEHSIMEIKNININKIFFIKIFFSKQSQYKNILKEKNINSYDIYDIEKYWEYEGIKIMN